MFLLTFLNQIFSCLCFCLQNINKTVRLLLAAVSINGLRLDMGLIQYKHTTFLKGYGLYVCTSSQGGYRKIQSQVRS